MRPQVFVLIIVGHLLPILSLVLSLQQGDGYLPFNASIFLNNYPIEDTGDQPKCQPMSIPFCKNSGYNKMMLPNFLGHNTQADVRKEIAIYEPLMHFNCSQDVKLFVCTVYAPMCFEDVNDANSLSLLPCRSLCESARRDCSPGIRSFNHEWPKALSCDKFPDRRTNSLCVGRDDDSGDNEYFVPSRAVIGNMSFVCPRNLESNSSVLHIFGKNHKNCALPCDQVFLGKSETSSVRTVVGTTSVICILATLFVCTTFLTDNRRFEYPMRPIIIIAFCQLMVAACYLAGFLMGKRMACSEAAEPPPSSPYLNMVPLVISGNKRTLCTLQFMTLYFFQTAGVLWWLMMTISWYMIARLKWAPECINQFARNFHLVSWTLPALMTIYLTAAGRIEGDPLSGTCYVSTTDQTTVLKFVILPTLACIVAGCGFSISGTMAISDSIEILKQDYKQTSEHYKMVMRIVLFSTILFILLLIFVSTLWTEQERLDYWMLAWLSKTCSSRDSTISCPPRNYSYLAPHYSTFIIKHCTTMAGGIFAATFMLSQKTLNSYKKVAELL